MIKIYDFSTDVKSDMTHQILSSRASSDRLVRSSYSGPMYRCAAVEDLKDSSSTVRQLPRGDDYLPSNSVQYYDHYLHSSNQANGILPTPDSSPVDADTST